MTLLIRSIERAMRPQAIQFPGPQDDWTQWQSAGIGWLSQAGITVTPQTAMMVSAIWACVRVITETIAAIPLPVYERVGDEKRRAQTLHLYDLLHDSPNDRQTSFAWREMLTGHACLRGNGLSEIVREGREPVGQLVPIHPSMVRVDTTDDGILRYWKKNPDGTEAKSPLLEDEVFHLRGLSDNGVLGMSVISMARESIGLARAAEEHGARTFENGPRLSGVLQHPGRISPDAAKGIRESWQSTYGGAANAGKVAVLWEDMKWQAIGMSNEDAQFISARQFQVEECARWFRMPLHMIGHTEKQTTWGCLPGNTMVFTADGPKPIMDIRAGDTVWALGEGGMERAVVTAQQMTGIRTIRTIKTIGRTLRLTDNHRVLIRRYRGRAVGKRGGAEWMTLWVPAEEIVRGDYLAIPHGLPSAGATVAPNGRRLTVAAMEFCGLYIGDGSRDKGRIEIAHEVDADHMVHYRTSIADEFGVKPYIDQRGTRTRFSSPEAIALLECGFTGTAHTKRVPTWVFSLTPELQTAFLRGYLDADGSVQRGRIIYSSASHALLEDTRHLCIQVGIPVGRVALGRRAGAGVIRGRSVVSTDKFQLSLSSTAHNHRIGSNSPRKAARFVGATGRRLCYDEGWTGGQGKGRRANLAAGHGWPYHGLKLQRVRSIEVGTEEMPVYDISVEGSQSFIADGVLVHNSGVEQMTIGFVIFTMLPWARRWEQQISKSLITDPKRYFAEFLFDGLLRGDLKSRYEAYAIAVQWGWMTRNEVRRLENMNPLDGMDEAMTPMNMAIGNPPRPLTPAKAATALMRGDDVRAIALPETQEGHELLGLLAKESAQRMVRMEIDRIRKAGQRYASDGDGFKRWLTEFYNGHAETLARTLHVSEQAAKFYADDQRGQVEREGLPVVESWGWQTDHLAGLMLGGAA